MRKNNKNKYILLTAIIIIIGIFVLAGKIIGVVPVFPVTPDGSTLTGEEQLKTITQGTKVRTYKIR